MARQRWNCLFHQYAKKEGGVSQLSGPGRYAYAVYNMTAQQSNGTLLALVQRERPKLLQDASGRPSVIYNGVSFGGASHTFAQVVDSWNPLCAELQLP
jgi:hypothetical protein